MNVYKSLVVGALVLTAGAMTPAFGQAAKAQEKAAPAAAAAAPAPAAGQYKIGVVDRKKILAKYKKVEAEYNNLKSEMETLQKPIDALTNEVNALKEAYDKGKETMTPQQRSDKELEIQTKVSEYQRLLQTNQDKLDAKERALMKNVLTEIDAAVEKLGETESYHLILEGSGHATAIYYSTTIDVTQKVIDILNSSAK